MVDEVAEFLTKALSQTGSEQLPYGESQKWTIRQHVADLLQVSMANLLAKTGSKHVPGLEWTRRCHDVTCVSAAGDPHAAPISTDLHRERWQVSIEDENDSVLTADAANITTGFFGDVVLQCAAVRSSYYGRRVRCQCITRQGLYRRLLL